MPNSTCFVLSTLEVVPPSVQQFLTLLYGLTSFVSLLGNITVILVQLIGNEAARNMRKYLINLAICDLISGVLCMPFSYTDFILRQWIFPHFLCPTTQYLQLLSVFITSITLTIIGLERYMAALHPLSRIHRWLKSHTNIILALVWLFGAAYSTIPFSHISTSAFEFQNTTYYECSYDNGLSLVKRRIFMNANVVLTFLVPSISMTFAYAAIMRKLRNSALITKHPYSITNITNSNSSSQHISGRRLPDVVVVSASAGRGSGASGPNTGITEIKFCTRNGQQLNGTAVLLQKSAHIKNRVKIIKMMFIIILLYDTCWLPIKLYQYLFDYDIISYCTESQFYTLIYIYIGCHWLAMFSSCCNPIIYSFFSQAFRNDFRAIVLKNISSCSKKNGKGTNGSAQCKCCQQRHSIPL